MGMASGMLLSCSSHPNNTSPLDNGKSVKLGMASAELAMWTIRLPSRAVGPHIVILCQVSDPKPRVYGRVVEPSGRSKNIRSEDFMKTVNWVRSDLRTKYEAWAAPVPNWVHQGNSDGGELARLELSSVPSCPVYLYYMTGLDVPL